MKKYIAILPFILSSCFGSPTQSFAITYGGWINFSLPDIVNTGVTLASTNIISEYETKSQVIDSANTVYSYLWCVELENGMSGVTLMTFRNYSQASSGWPYGVWAEVNLKIDQIVSWTNSGKSIIYMEWYWLYSDDDFSRVAIAYVPSIHNSYLWDTTKWLFCFNPVIFKRNWWWVFDINDWLYIQNISYTYYSWPTWRYWFWQIDFSSLHFWLWAQIFKRVAAESSPPYWVNYTRLEMYWNTSLNTKIWYQYDPLISTVSIFDFLSTLTWSNIDQTIPQFLSMVSATWSSFNDWWGTGTTRDRFDYSECWVIEIWCYFDVFTNVIGVYLDSFFPDISWTWNFDSCASWSTDSGSTLQKFANVIAIINPYPPEEWTSICSIFGDYTIWYQRLFPEHNFFEVYAPWVFPALEIDWRVFGGQSLPDIIVIIAMSILILHPRNKND